MKRNIAAMDAERWVISNGIVQESAATAIKAAMRRVNVGLNTQS